MKKKNDNGIEDVFAWGFVCRYLYMVVFLH